jgi:TolA-binding protein
VHIRSQSLGDLYLSEGQSLVFDEATGQYKIVGGGPVVAREAIESMPEMKALGSYQVLAIAANVPQAEITIDGRYRGVAPMAILQAPGPHRISLSKNGYQTLDTIITVNAGEIARLAMSLSAEKTETAPVAKLVARPAKVAAVQPAVQAEPEIAKPKALDAEALFRQAEAAQNTNWVLAIKLFEEVLAQGGPGIRREAALFSIAKLRADHAAGELDRTTAKQEFLDYLARYPQGAFTGESWLRLAELELNGQPEKAIEYYLKVFERYPRHHRLSELQHRVGLIYLQQKRYDEAAGMFRQGLSNVLLDGETEKRKLLQGLHRALVAKGDTKAAERVESDLLKSK